MNVKHQKVFCAKCGYILDLIIGYKCPICGCRYFFSCVFVNVGTHCLDCPNRFECFTGYNNEYRESWIDRHKWQVSVDGLIVS